MKLAGRYTIADIEALWTEYRAAMAIRVLRDGKWDVSLPTGAMGRIQGTRAERVKAHTVMTFPEWLRKAGHA